MSRYEAEGDYQAGIESDGESFPDLEDHEQQGLEEPVRYFIERSSELGVFDERVLPLVHEIARQAYDKGVEHGIVQQSLTGERRER